VICRTCATPLVLALTCDYSCTVKPLLFPSSACGLIAICGFLALDRPAAQAKPIRLRNEIIPTEASAQGTAKAASALPQSPVSGLVLVQVAGAMTPSWQAELRSLGVELLKYVPDDAFITKFNNVPTDKIRALGFVRWVGPYRPDHKIHPRLAAAARLYPPYPLPHCLNRRSRNLED